MTAKNDFQRILDSLTEEIKEQIDNNITSIRGVSAEQENDSSAEAEDFEFRPLTEEEKKEFVNSLDAKGKQILADLAGKAKDSNNSAA
jgi:DNA-binding transcriptional regulator GbsR (MarR family)